jgi:hypothetical protein
VLNRISGSPNPLPIQESERLAPSKSESSTTGASLRALPYPEGYSNPRLPNDPTRASFLSKTDNEMLEQMRFSTEEMKRTLASNVDNLTANAKSIGWDRSFKAATNISMKAMRCIGTEQSRGKNIFSLSQSPEEIRAHHQPFVHTTMPKQSYDSDNYKPVKGDLKITSPENSCIQKSLISILEKEFPEKMKNLKEENDELQRRLKTGEFDLNRRSFERISN